MGEKLTADGPWTGMDARWLASSEMGARFGAVVDLLVPPGAGYQPYRHLEHERVVYVWQGEGTHLGSGGPSSMHADDVLVIPPGSCTGSPTTPLTPRGCGSPGSRLPRSPGWTTRSPPPATSPTARSSATGSESAPRIRRRPRSNRGFRTSDHLGRCGRRPRDRARVGALRPQWDPSHASPPQRGRGDVHHGRLGDARHARTPTGDARRPV